MTVPGSGDLIGDPAPAATGAAEAAGAGATGAAGRATGLGASTRTFFNVALYFFDLYVVIDALYFILIFIHCLMDFWGCGNVRCVM